MFPALGDRPASLSITFLRRMYPYLPDFGSSAFRRWLVKFIPNPQALKMQEITDTLWRRSTEIYQAKKLALEQGDDAVTREMGEGKDLMSILRKFIQHSCGNKAVYLMDNWLQFERI